MVDRGDHDEAVSGAGPPFDAPAPPSRAASPVSGDSARPAPTGWSRPDSPPVDPDAPTTELPRATYPAPEPRQRPAASRTGDAPAAPVASPPSAARLDPAPSDPRGPVAGAPPPGSPSAAPGALPGGSPFGASAPGDAWTAPSSTPDPRAPSPSPNPSPTSIPTGWAPLSGARPGGGPAGDPSGWAPANPAPVGSGPGGALDPRWRATPLVVSDRPADAADVWWNRASGPSVPSSPPQYDPSRYGALGAAGGVPLLPPAAVGPGVGRPRSSMRAAVLVGVLSAVIASLITGGLFVAFTDDRPVEREVATDRGPAPTLVAPLDIYDLLERAQPSVVSIRTDVSSSSGTTPFGAGSGVIISEDGLVLTNAHVIAGSTTMRVTLHDGQEQDATLVGSFPDDDIALIRLAQPEGLVPAVLGSSADIVVGDPVVAIGNALNLGGPPSVTEGIVSAKDRNIQTSEGTLRNLIQTDAAINPGNSGGPLLNAQGQVVGINTAIIDDAQNIGFAISIDLLKPLIEDLKEGRGDITPESPFLGVSTQTLGDVTDAVLERYGVTANDGAFVSDVVPGSGAAEAGLQPGDVIISIDGQNVSSSTDVGAIIRNREAGEMITIEIERQGEPETLTATLKSRG